MQILWLDLPVFVLVVQLHELHDAVRPIQVYQVLILIIGHEIAVHREKSHLFYFACLWLRGYFKSF